MKNIYIIVTISFSLFNTAQASTPCTPPSTCQSIPANTLAITDLPRNSIISSYSPWVMKQSGWTAYRMYLNRNVRIGRNGLAGDRIYLSENYGSLYDNSWSEPKMVLNFGYEEFGYTSRLIADPTVVVVNNGSNFTWHMYYTCTDNANGYRGQICRATSNNGVNFVKKGRISIHGLRAPVGNIYGIGEPSIIFNNTKKEFILYFYDDSRPNQTTTLFAATSTNGYNFSEPKAILPNTKERNLIIANPGVRLDEESGKYYLTFGNFNGTREAFLSTISACCSTDPFRFDLNMCKKVVSKDTQPDGWDSKTVSHGDIRPEEGVIFYAGTSMSYGGNALLDDGQIGVANIGDTIACYTPTTDNCYDNIRNGNETSIDTGGRCGETPITLTTIDLKHGDTVTKCGINSVELAWAGAIEGATKYHIGTHDNTNNQAWQCSPLLSGDTCGLDVLVSQQTSSIRAVSPGHSYTYWVTDAGVGDRNYGKSVSMSFVVPECSKTSSGDSPQLASPLGISSLLDILTKILGQIKL